MFFTFIRPFIVGGGVAAILVFLVGYRFHVVSVTKLEEAHKITQLALKQTTEDFSHYAETVKKYNEERETDEKGRMEIPEFEGNGCHLTQSDLDRLQNGNSSSGKN